MKKLVGIAFLVLSTFLLAVPVMAPIGEISIDVKPNSCPNAINPNSRGSTPVAIRTHGSLDASDVDPLTVMFLGAPPLRWAMEDFDGDGDMDLVLHFDTQACDWAADPRFEDRGTYLVEPCLTGETFGGDPFWGKAWIKITKGFNDA